MSIDEKVLETVKLDDLCGLRMLDARADFVGAKQYEWQDEDPHVVVLRLDGTLYWFQEDPGDGYRSGLAFARVANRDEIPSGALIEFAPRLVGCTHQTTSGGDFPCDDDILVGTDESTGTELFRIGTTNIDDYYPGFVSHWTPPAIDAARGEGVK